MLDQVADGGPLSRADSARRSQLLEDLGTQLASLRERVGSCYEEFHFYQGCVLVMAALRTTNQAVQAHQPWLRCCWAN